MLWKTRKAAYTPTHFSDDHDSFANTVFSVCAILFCIAAFVFVPATEALTITGFAAVSVLLFIELRRRYSWENRSHRQLKALKKRQDMTAEQIMRQSQDVESLKSGLSMMSDDILDLSKNLTKHSYNLHNVIQGVSKRLNNDKSVEKQNLSPLLKRPVKDTSLMQRQTSQTAQKTYRFSRAPAVKPRSYGSIANDDPYGEYASLSHAVIEEMLDQAIKNKRVDLFMQPIVGLPSRRELGYEFFARIRAKPGLYIPASMYMKIAKAKNVEAQIDMMILEQSLQAIKNYANRPHYDRNVKFFINVRPSIFKNKNYMKTLLNFAAHNRDLAEHIIFEMSQSTFEKSTLGMQAIMEALSRLRFSFSLDNVESLDFSADHYRRCHIRFLKIHANWMRNMAKDETEFTQLWMLKKKLEGQSIRMIVSHVEDEAVMKDLLDYNIGYGQGYLFGKPDFPGAFTPFATSSSFVKRKGVLETFG